MSIAITIIILLTLIIFHYADDARLAWRIASERDNQIRALELRLRAHLPPAELAELEEEEAELDALMKKYEKGAF